MTRIGHARFRRPVRACIPAVRGRLAKIREELVEAIKWNARGAVISTPNGLPDTE
jgi:hypothetical protein